MPFCLFLDLAFAPVIALFEEGQLLGRREIVDLKNESIHFCIYDLLKKRDISPRHLKTIVYCAGPGSYTGIRFSQAISEYIGRSEGEIEVANFYHYEWPSLSLGVSSGFWVSTAQKREFFVYSYRSGESALMSPEQLTVNLASADIWASTTTQGNEITKETGLPIAGFTHELIKKNWKDPLEKIKNRDGVLPLLYYRSLEEEFKVKVTQR